MEKGRNNTKLVLAFVALLTFGNLNARTTSNNGNNNKGGGSNPTPAAGCSPAIAISSLQFNNVRARIDATGGSMWQDRANSIASYNIPKQKHEDDPLYTALYAGSLWIGGQDPTGQLKVAAVQFRQGGANDFWPGPLTTDGTAEVDPLTCEIFDQFFGVSRPIVNEFVSWFNDPSSNPGYQIHPLILNYPAKGNTVKKREQAYYVAEELAPFYDYDGDGVYDPTKGDYPKYDLIGDVDCRTTRDIRLFGDSTIWFVFNDKGNTHTESQGASIGMEIRGQAFAFATNDEINDMTFYNYELINRSSFTFTDTYFGQWVDPDLGNSNDDYVGCDASRGLGYVYNGDNMDEDANGVTGYGSTPPFVGVDFFEGPYMDNDSIDNPLTSNIQDALDSNGIPYSGLGIGYGDGVIDNERYGMRKFVYYNIGSVVNGNGDPRTAVDYYNYLRGRWLDGVGPMTWGGVGNPSVTGNTIQADLLFPGDSDPLFWSTQGVSVTPVPWTEAVAGNPKGDRRFIQSAGPFTLLPGAVNDITVGVVFARALSGDNLASLSALKVADDKAQSLFDNCFKILEGPNAPDIAIQELENELILFLSNNNPISNNYKEGAKIKDPFISIPDTIDGVYQGTEEERDTLTYYTFQGYQIYQIKNASVSVSQLDDPSVARLIAQVDIEDNIGQIVNYEYDDAIKANVPKEMVSGKNLGIRHSFRVTEDAFASGASKKLVNHKSYHFIAIAYAYNNWKTVDPQNFSLGGQLKPYLASRTNSTGGTIKAYTGIPHTSQPKNGGTIVNSNYGDAPEITRIEGAGNGGLVLNLTSTSEAQIVSYGFMDYPIYQAGQGPIDVKVVDPLNVKEGTYYLQFMDSTTAPAGVNSLNDAIWRVINGADTIYSERNIAALNEQVFANLGFSVAIRQTTSPGSDPLGNNGFLSASITYSDATKPWLTGVFDTDNATQLNWIRSGIQDTAGFSEVYMDHQEGGEFIDANQSYENILRGTWAPHRMVSSVSMALNRPLVSLYDAPGIAVPVKLSSGNVVFGGTVNYPGSKLSNLSSVDIVFTSDKSKWTRCIVYETGSNAALTEGNELLFNKRAHLNVDKNGNADGTVNSVGSGNGMGWFPGYAINVETGERLNMAFGENSARPDQNGADMKWNPTNVQFDFMNFPIIDTALGGRHYVYVFKSRYDECKKLDSLYSVPRGVNPVSNHVKNIAKTIAETCMWVGFPTLQEGESLLSNDARIQLRVKGPYTKFATTHSAYAEPVGNAQRPMYMFNMDNFAAEIGVASAAKEMLDKIKAVPNPYYAYSQYESDKFDNRIKITNLPEKCTISIYNTSGTLMRRYVKGSSITSLDWDLKNQAGIPVAGGVYLIHVEVPEVGETVIKWFGVTRPTDLNGL
ncbi:MAG: T9SS C-terminal target domain-containing protein [Flavobacteriales bacterium]|nr:MAG: T9SS C-terminal target domain-containing protein [Flavobacteriales bacterium]